MSANFAVITTLNIDLFCTAIAAAADAEIYICRLCRLFIRTINFCNFRGQSVPSRPGGPLERLLATGVPVIKNLFVQTTIELVCIHGSLCMHVAFRFFDERFDIETFIAGGMNTIKSLKVFILFVSKSLSILFS